MWNVAIKWFHVCGVCISKHSVVIPALLCDQLVVYLYICDFMNVLWLLLKTFFHVLVYCKTSDKCRVPNHCLVSNKLRVSEAYDLITPGLE